MPKLRQDFASKIKIEDLINDELTNHECYYTGDYQDVIDIVKSYYPNLSDKTIFNKVKDVYYKNKNINI